MVSFSNTNVGIGTTSPASKLHVSSSTLIVDGTGGKIQFVDGSTQATAPGPKAIQVFTANGTYTPTAGATIAIVECVGGGQSSSAQATVGRGGAAPRGFGQGGGAFVGTNPSRALEPTTAEAAAERLASMPAAPGRAGSVLSWIIDPLLG